MFSFFQVILYQFQPQNRPESFIFIRGVIAEMANDIAWDAVGAQIEPYHCQHVYWQRPCGVALGCRSLNSHGIKTAAASRSLYQQWWTSCGLVGTLPRNQGMDLKQCQWTWQDPSIFSSTSCVASGLSLTWAFKVLVLRIESVLQWW